MATINIFIPFVVNYLCKYHIDNFIYDLKIGGHKWDFYTNMFLPTILNLYIVYNNYIKTKHPFMHKSKEQKREKQVGTSITIFTD